MLPLKGIHHVSAITANAKKNYEFYTHVMGMRLVKKTVNQDDTSMYHLFYADERGNPGTDLTFFEIPRAGNTYFGSNSISGTSLRIKNDATLNYWLERLSKFEVEHDGIVEIYGRKTIPFRDFEKQRLFLVSDEKNKGVEAGNPWSDSPVPIEYGITGLGPSILTVRNLLATEKTLTEVLTFKKIGEYSYENHAHHVFSTGEGGTGAEVHVVERKDLPKERPGRGSVHHVALRVEDDVELHNWVEHIHSLRLPNSGFVERYYFKSLYFREPNGILFELATDGPGFENDEEFENLGERLALPPYLEHKRKEIEAKLQPLDTIEKG